MPSLEFLLTQQKELMKKSNNPDAQPTKDGATQGNPIPFVSEPGCSGAKKKPANRLFNIYYLKKQLILAPPTS